jgi:DUF971 family protein
MRPDAVTVGENGCVLLARWPAGAEARIEAALLWAECPSAQGRRRRLEGAQVCPPRDLTIIGVKAIGNYAINIAFSDGHDRGVYPWALLATLAQRPKAEDFMRPNAEDFIITASADAARAQESSCP